MSKVYNPLFFYVGAKVRLQELPKQFLAGSLEDRERVLKTIFSITEIAPDRDPENALASIKALSGVQKLIVPISNLEPYGQKTCIRDGKSHDIGEFQIISPEGYLSHVCDQNLLKSDIAMQRFSLKNALTIFKIGEVMSVKEMGERIKTKYHTIREQKNFVATLLRFEFLQETETGSGYYLSVPELQVNVKKERAEEKPKETTIVKAEPADIKEKPNPVVKPEPAPEPKEELKPEPEQKPIPQPQPEQKLRPQLESVPEPQEKYDPVTERYKQQLEEYNVAKGLDDISFLEVFMSHPGVCIRCGSKVRTSKLGGGKLSIRKKPDLSAFSNAEQFSGATIRDIEDHFCLLMLHKLMKSPDIKIARGSCIHSALTPGVKFFFHKDFGK